MSMSTQVSFYTMHSKTNSIGISHHMFNLWCHEEFQGVFLPTVWRIYCIANDTIDHMSSPKVVSENDWKGSKCL